MIKTASNDMTTKKLFVCGGTNVKSNLYDLKTKTWSITNGAKLCCGGGICYDDRKQWIHQNGEYSAKSFDLRKEKWSSLPNTFMDYDRHSKMWFNQYNRNLLFVAAFNKNNSMECIDVRCDKKWRLLRVPSKQHSLSNMFGVPGDHVFTSRLCVSAT